MSYISKIIANTRAGSISPAKHTKKNNGKPVGAGHLKRHEEGKAHKSVGELICTGVNIVKEGAKKVDEKVIQPAKEAGAQIVDDAKRVIEKKKEAGLLQKRGKKKKY
jgi:hypothetical protein